MNQNDKSAGVSNFGCLIWGLSVIIIMFVSLWLFFKDFSERFINLFI